MGELIAFCLIVWACVWGAAIVFAIAGSLCILAKGALCALWHNIAR